MNENFLIKDSALLKYKGTDEYVYIPDGVIYISPYAFSNNPHVKYIVVPDSVTEIKNNAFYACSGLEKITMSDSVKKLGFAVFSLCAELREITLSSSLEEIPDKCFYRCTNLSSITLPSSIRQIGKEAFSKAGLRNIHIPDSVSLIDSSTFSNCKRLEHVTLSKSLTEIGENAFLRCMFEKVIIPRNVSKIKNNAFYGCSQLKSIIFEDNNTEFEGCPFSYCNHLCDENGMLILDNKLFYSLEQELLIIPEGVEDRQRSCNAKNVVLSVSQKQLNIASYKRVKRITLYDTTKLICDTAGTDEEIYTYLSTFFKNLEIVCLSSETNNILYKLRIDLREEHPDLLIRMSVFLHGNLSENLPRFDLIFQNIRNIKSKADIAFDRLEYEYNLSASAKQKYHTFLEENAGRICLEYLKCKDDDSVYKLSSLNYYNLDDIEKLLEYTSKNKNEIMTAYFLDYSHNKLKNLSDKKEEYL